MANKFHVNENGEAKSCRATKRPCRFGDSLHFENKEDAVKAAENILSKKHSSILSAMKRAKLPNSYSPKDDLSGLTPDERANVLVFEAMKRTYAFALGDPDDDYYGSGKAVVSPEDHKKLKALGLNRNPERYTVDYLEENGVSLKVIPNSLRETKSYHFEHTFTSSNREVEHMTAKVVLTTSSGHQLAINSSTKVGFEELLDESLQIADSIEAKVELLLVEREHKKKKRNNKY